MTERTNLYLAYGEGNTLLYIGCAKDLVRRMKTHAKNAAWFSQMQSTMVKTYPTREHALKVEARAISLMKPMYNVHSQRDERARRRLAISDKGRHAQSAAGKNFGRAHSITDNPKRLAAMRPYVESGEADTMHPKEALKILNAADRKARAIKSEETFRRWRRDGYPGIEKERD